MSDISPPAPEDCAVDWQMSSLWRQNKFAYAEVHDVARLYAGIQKELACDV